MNDLRRVSAVPTVELASVPTAFGMLLPLRRTHMRPVRALTVEKMMLIVAA
jgi:hypothetical protein